MSNNTRGLQVHSDDQQQEYEREARLAYDPSIVNDSIQRWNSYSDDQQEAIKAEQSQIYVDLADAMDAGKDENSPEVEVILNRWVENLRHFYEPSLDMLRGLGEMYNMDERFRQNFQNIHPDLPQFLTRVIDHYVDKLETAEIERMLAEDDDMAQRRNNLSQ
jgi:hypothetical protein